MCNIGAVAGLLVSRVAPLLNTASILDIRQFKSFIRPIDTAPQRPSAAAAGKNSVSQIATDVAG
jgi:hypothetical protein